MTNAVKYGDPDKPITVSLENKEEEVILRVHNYGNPISAEKQKNIFSFLNRSNEESRGNLKSWGIGLSFVKMAAEAHQGNVELKSSTEHGTTFSVRLKKYSNRPGKKKTVLNLVKNPPAMS